MVVVEAWTNRPERLSPASVLHGPDGPLEVVSASPASRSGGRHRWIVAFRGVDTREAADSLRGAVLKAEALEDAGALWVHELVGATVLSAAGDVIGTVSAVEANPASDLLVLADGRLIPLRFVVEQTPDGVTVDVPEGLLEL